MKINAASQSSDNSQRQLATALPNRWVILGLCGILFLALVLLQYRLWIADGSVSHTADLKRQLAVQQAANDALQNRNDRLLTEIGSLKQGPGQIEARAREDLGLIKEGETFFMFFDAPVQTSASAER